MKKVKIYLRSILQDNEERLALFDSNREGGINDLTTEVEPGATVIWKPDCRSGIKAINRIRPKEGEGLIFGTEVKKRIFGKGFRLKTSKEAKGREAYDIEYVDCAGKKVSIDPYLKMKVPD